MSSETLPSDWEPLLRRPLISSAQLRRQLRKELPKSDARYIVEEMLKGCTPKTTPLYLRMIHASAYWLMKHPDEDPEKATVVVKTVAESVKRFDLVINETQIQNR